MKRLTIPLFLAVAACAATAADMPGDAGDRWTDYNVGRIKFIDRAPETEGSRIYHAIITDAESYIAAQARDVLATLYFSPEDSIVPVHRIVYSLRDVDGISAKSGGGGRVGVFYSTRHIERSFDHGDTARVLHETRGVLLHELTHAYQLEPQGIGGYGDSKVVWSFIEGMADAMRVANGGFTAADRIPGGHYDDGYRQTGFFLNWVRENKNGDFLRLMNRSTLEVVPWSWDGAVKYALGPDADVEALWQEYLAAMGDVK